jgi:mono/diheme cytochrome c family protein
MNNSNYSERPHSTLCRVAFFVATSLASVQADDAHQASDAFYAQAAALLPAFQGVPAPVDPAECQALGGWTNPIAFPHVPVTTANLPDGRILTFSSNQRTSFPTGPEFTYAAVYNPDTGNITELNWNQHDMFCGGTVLRPDGKLQVMGGRATIQSSSTFDWQTNAWARVANMNDPRWYTTSLAMPNGEVFTVSGSGGPNSAERFNGSSWLKLTGINWSPIAGQPYFEANWTPLVFQAPNGKLFQAGPTPQMHWVDPTGTGSLTAAGLSIPGTWYPKDSGVAMYDVGKILFAGGVLNGNSEAPVNQCYTVDLNTNPPTVTQVASMLSIRRFSNAITLPNGEVLVMGGNTSGQKFSDVGSVLGPEIWNPRTNQWRKVADMSVPRNYHSVALLLADGRVMSGGGGLAGNAAVDHADIQLYNPPCLYTATGTLATRPVLNTAPASIGLTGRFTVQGTAGLKKFAFIRMTSTTHSMTTDQRYISLPYTEISNGVYELSPYANRYIMTPGYWMLYGLDAQGVHSKAKIIKVDEAATVAISGTNLALNKSASQSSTASAGGTADKAVNGSREGNFTIASGTATNTQANPYWEVDLGANYPVNALRIFNRTDDGGKNLIDFTAYVSSFPFAIANTDVRGYRHINMAGVEADINIYRAARYVRVQLNGTGTLQLAEVEVLGINVPIGGTFLENPGTQLHERGTPVSLTLNAVGPSSLTYTALNLPTGLGINSSTGAISGTPSLKGTFNTSVTVTATNGDTSTTTFTWRIYPPAERPGVLYDYYEGTWTTLPAFNNLTPVASGETDRCNLAPKLRADNFAMFFKGCFRVLTAGTWTFSSNSDDGSQIWIDGQLVVDHNGIHTVAEKSGSVSLTPGIHNITVAYFQSVGASTLDVSYAGPGVTKQIMSDAILFQPRPGVHYDFYQGNWGALPNFATLTPVKSGYVDNFTLAPRTTNDLFAFRFTAKLRVPTAGTYTFFTTSDDGSQLKIDGVLVVNNDGLHAAQEVGGTKVLIAGEHDIEVTFFEQGIDETLIVSYSGPGIAKQVIPTGALSTHGLPGLAPTVNAIANQSTIVGNSVNLAVVGNDANGDTLNYTATNLPPGLNLGPATGIISGAPTSAGTYATTITVSDGTGLSATTNFTWTVLTGMTLQPLSATPRAVNTSISYSVLSTGGVNPRFKWNFGDGTAETAYSATRTIAKTFTNAGRYQVTITATDDSGLVLTTSFYQAVSGVLTTNKPAQDSPLAYEVRATGGDRVWVVNPDQDTVTAYNTNTNAKVVELGVGDQPVSLAFAPNGLLWVVNKKSASITQINVSTLTVSGTINLARASLPHGLAFSPTADAAYVAQEALGQLLKLNVTTAATIGSVSVGADARHLSIKADGGKVYVSRFITPFQPGEATGSVTTTLGTNGAEVVVVTSSTMLKDKTILLRHSEKPDAENGGRGIPNYLGAAVISPDGTAAWVPSKQDNFKRGQLRDGQQLTHDSTLRAIGSRIALATETEDYAARIDIDNAGVPSMAVYDLSGCYVFVALEASREVAVLDAHNKNFLFKFNVGRAPQGLMVSPDNARLYVHNFMDRSVTVHNVSSIINGGNPLAASVSTLSTWNTVGAEILSSQILLGKQFFYDAADPRMALQGYISCASCHNDGGHDGRVWDFTGIGEGLRNTTDLRGKAGTTGHGPAHWTGNFDEIQDFEKQIRDLARGTGLMTNTQFNTGTRNQPLGDSKAGVSADLDALAAYVTSLGTEPASPYRNTDGSLTAAAVAGKEVFRTANCASCHSGNGFTESALNVLRNIGTIKPSSGKRLGATLTGFDTPTLRGIWSTAPYFHDGSAATLTAAVTGHTGVNLTSTDLTNLVAYLQQIDPSEPTAPTTAAPTVGLKAEYFQGPTPGLAAPILTRVDPKIDFEWSGGSPAASVPNDNFSARWTGFLIAPYSETYTIFAPADDGLRIWINNQLVLDKWPNPGGWPSFTIALTGGQRVPIKVEFSETTGGAAISLYWYSTSQGWEAISKFVPPDFTNRAPTITSPGAQTTQRSTSASLQIVAADQDGDSLTYSATGLPIGLSINTQTGVISGTVSVSAAATNSTIVTARDAGNLSASATFTWNTTAPPANRPPTINNPGSQTFVRSTIATLGLVASDPDGQTLAWSASGLPAGLSINSTTGLISGTVSATAAASGTSTVTVTDPGNLTASATFTYATVAPSLTGLKAEYFDGLTPGIAPPLLTRTDATIDFDWGSGSPAPGIPIDFFSVRWTGTMTPLYSETYNFSLPSDNGVRLWINNQLVLDKWSPNDAHGWYNFSVPLTAGVPAAFKIEYFELYGGATIALYWYSLSQGWEIISTNRFTPASTALAGSTEHAAAMVASTQAIQRLAGDSYYFTFKRPSASAGELLLMVEQSEDLEHWTLSNTPAIVSQLKTGTDKIYIPVPVPTASGGTARKLYFRVRFLH